MAQQLHIALQPFPSQRNLKAPLEDLIKQISQQKGSFRDVSENGLEEEIQDARNGDEVAVEFDLEEDDTSDPKADREGLLKTKEQLLKEVS